MTPWQERVEIGPHVLYLGDCREIDLQADAVVSDPPYGMDWDTDTTRFSGGFQQHARGRDWGAAIHGDDEPFDPSPWIGYPAVVLWGANHYAQRLPVGTTLVWIKRNDDAFGSFLSDAEIAWAKGGHGVYCRRVLFPPPTKAAETGIAVHPTQKPIALMRWSIERGAPDAQTILDPFMGSGTTGVACAKLGRKFIGVEIHEPHFRIACRRIADAYAGGVQPDLFAAKPREADTAQEALFQ